MARRVIIKQIISVIAMRPAENTGGLQRPLAHTVTRWLRADMVPWLMRPRRCTLQIAPERGCSRAPIDEEKLAVRDLRAESFSVTTSDDHRTCQCDATRRRDTIRRVNNYILVIYSKMFRRFAIFICRVRILLHVPQTYQMTNLKIRFEMQGSISFA